MNSYETMAMVEQEWRDRCDAANKTCADLRTENARLREALREHAIEVRNWYGATSFCRVCRIGWYTGAKEQHQPGCLAAPKEDSNG